MRSDLVMLAIGFLLGVLAAHAGIL